MPKISVIIPMYNVDKYLRKCLDSVLSQTFTDFDVILVDDGSTDNSGKICDEYALKDSRFNVIHKQNGGVASARNAGLDWVREKSDSEWISFIDSDDFVSENYLETLYNAVIEHDADIAVVDSINVDEQGNAIDEQHGAFKFEILNRNESVTFSNEWKMTVPWAKIYKKSVYDGLKYPPVRIHEDAYLCHHVLGNSNKMVVLDKVCYFYFQRSSSLTKMEFSHAELDGYLDGFEAVLDRYLYAKENNIDMDFTIVHYQFWEVVHLFRKYSDKQLFNRFEKLKKIYKPLFFSVKDNRTIKKRIWYNLARLNRVVSRIIGRKNR